MKWTREDDLILLCQKKVWRFFLEKKNSACCLLKTKWLMKNYTLQFDEKICVPAEFFFSKKIRQMKAGQNNKYDMYYKDRNLNFLSQIWYLWFIYRRSKAASKCLMEQRHQMKNYKPRYIEPCYKQKKPQFSQWCDDSCSGLSVLKIKLTLSIVFPWIVSSLE